jgi:hypothetical protein
MEGLNTDGRMEWLKKFVVADDYGLCYNTDGREVFEVTMLTRNEFNTARAWHRACIGGQSVILRHTSALEHLELFVGYVRERRIDVYTRDQSIDSRVSENVNYHVVDSFDNIDFVSFGNVLCTSISQTFNDMLDDFDSIDEQPLIEGLSRYYHTHGNSFDGLFINPRHRVRFNSIRSWAFEYYDEV